MKRSKAVIIALILAIFAVNVMAQDQQYCTEMTKITKKCFRDAGNSVKFDKAVRGVKNKYLAKQMAELSCESGYNYYRQFGNVSDTQLDYLINAMMQDCLISK